MSNHDEGSSKLMDLYNELKRNSQGLDDKLANEDDLASFGTSQFLKAAEEIRKENHDVFERLGTKDAKEQSARFARAHAHMKANKETKKHG